MFEDLCCNYPISQREIDEQFFVFEGVLRRSVCVNKRCNRSEENVVNLLACCTAGTTGLK